MYKWLISYRMENDLKGQFIVVARSLATAVLLAEVELKETVDCKCFITGIECVR